MYALGKVLIKLTNMTNIEWEVLKAGFDTIFGEQSASFCITLLYISYFSIII